jgi:hypothetical protein
MEAGDEVPVDEQFERRRTAVAALTRSVLDHLAAKEGQPRIGRMIDIRRWWRHGQEDFVGLQPRAWSMPADVPIVGWLDKFPVAVQAAAAYQRRQAGIPRPRRVQGSHARPQRGTAHTHHVHLVNATESYQLASGWWTSPPGWRSWTMLSTTNADTSTTPATATFRPDPR